jgi:hypothetical protein
MYKKNRYENTKLNINKSLEGETIEIKVERITQNNEPITDGAPLIYTDRQDGVQAGYNIKTDRFEIAIDAMDKVAKSVTARREERAQMKVIKNDGDTEPTQGNGTDK